jgi:uncharacterized protein
METDMGICVVVVYSPAAREVHEVALTLEDGMTVMHAIRLSGLLTQFPELDISQSVVGVWERKATPDHSLRDRDRIEIYRALQVNPQVARRERFVKQGARTTGLFAKKRLGAKAGY